MLEFKDPGSILILVDGDEFEPRNAERQSFTALGNKAEVKAEALTPYFEKTFVAPKAQMVVDQFEDPELEETEDAITASALMQDGDVVFAVVDNFAARKVLFDAAREFDNIDVFTGGNDENLYGSVYHYQRRNGEDITDHPAEYHEQLINPPDRNPALMSCQEKAELAGGTQLIAVNFTVAGVLLIRYQHTIIDGNDPRPAGEILFDFGLGMAQASDRTADPVSVSV